MNDELKTHAKEYLVDFSKNQPDWLKFLIFEAINTNGKISVEKLNDIYSCLKEDKDVQLPYLNASSTTNPLKQTEIAEIISKAKKDTALIKHETWEEVIDSEAYTEGMTVLRERGYWIIQDLNQ